MGQERFEVIGERLVRRFQTRDPFEIAQGLGIVVYDDCEGFGDLKGMYSVVKKQRSIFLNKNLDERTARIVCAHEIGHDQLHRDIVKQNRFLQEFQLYNMASRREYEANIVGASILLSDEEILDYIYHYRFDSEQIARATHTDINLVALKVAHLIEKGYKLRALEHNSKFLKG